MVFNTSYVELRSKGYVHVVGAGPFQVQSPKSWGSYASRLTQFLLAGHGNPEIDRQVRMSAEAIDRVLTWINLNAPYYPEYAGGAFRDHPFGRSPLNQAQLARLGELTGSNLLDPREFARLSFTRPESSPCLARLNCSGESYREALAILRMGQQRLAVDRRPDMPGFRLVDPTEIQQEKKYQFRWTQEARRARRSPAGGNSSWMRSSLLRLEQPCPAPANRDFFDQSQARIFCGGHFVGESLAGNVHSGFGHEQSAVGLEAAMDLAQQAAQVRHFVKHGKGECEVGLKNDPQPVLLAPMELDSVGHTRLECSPLQHVEHLLLKINGDHSALLADHPRHGNREPTHPAAHVQRGHAGLDVRPNDLLRIVNQAAERIIDRKPNQPPGAYVSSHGSKDPVLISSLVLKNTIFPIFAEPVW